MNRDAILKAIKQIEQVKDDNTPAHQQEDELHINFIKHVATLGNPLAELATLVLSTDKIDFARWYE